MHGSRHAPWAVLLLASCCRGCWGSRRRVTARQTGESPRRHVPWRAALRQANSACGCFVDAVQGVGDDHTRLPRAQVRVWVCGAHSRRQAGAKPRDLAKVPSPVLAASVARLETANTRQKTVTYAATASRCGYETGCGCHHYRALRWRLRALLSVTCVTAAGSAVFACDPTAGRLPSLDCSIDLAGIDCRRLRRRCPLSLQACPPRPAATHTSHRRTAHVDSVAQPGNHAPGPREGPAGTAAVRGRER